MVYLPVYLCHFYMGSKYISDEEESDEPNEQVEEQLKVVIKKSDKNNKEWEIGEVEKEEKKGEKGDQLLQGLIKIKKRKGEWKKEKKGKVSPRPIPKIQIGSYSL